MNRLFLFVILLVYVLTGALYAVQTPNWQAPDEPAHFNYIRTIAETGTLPILQPGDYDQEYLERIKSTHFPPSLSVDPIRYESYSPPLYYLAATPVYLAASVGGLDTEVVALRMFSVLLEVLVLLVAFRIVSEIFPEDRVLPLATVGLMATVPMHVAITASIGSDTAGELVVALILLLAVLRIKGRVSARRYVIAGGVLFGAALLTKTTAYATGAALLVLAELPRTRWGGRTSLRAPSVKQSPPTNGGNMAAEEIASSCGTARRPPRNDDPPPTRNDVPPPPNGVPISGMAYVQHLIALFAIALVIASPMFARNMITYGIGDPLGLARHDLIVAGQPTTAQIIAQYGWKHVLTEGVTVTFRSFWGQFGWMGVLMSDRVYLLLAAFTVVGFAGFGLFALRRVRDRSLPNPTQWWCLILCAALILTAIVAYIGYNFKFYQLQGRYLFPAFIPLALFFALGLRELVARYARWLFALVYLALVGLDIAALFLYIIPQLRIAS